MRFELFKKGEGHGCAVPRKDVVRDMKSNFETLNTRPGLYRVWVPLRDDGKQPLVCIWMDSTMQAFEAQLGRDNDVRGAEIESETSDEGAEGPLDRRCEPHGVWVGTLECPSERTRINHCLVVRTQR